MSRRPRRCAITSCCASASVKPLAGVRPAGAPHNGKPHSRSPVLIPMSRQPSPSPPPCFRSRSIRFVWQHRRRRAHPATRLQPADRRRVRLLRRPANHERQRVRKSIAAHPLRQCSADSRPATSGRKPRAAATSLHLTPNTREPPALGIQRRYGSAWYNGFVLHLSVPGTLGIATWLTEAARARSPASPT